MTAALHTVSHFVTNPETLIAKQPTAHPATVCAWCGKVRTSARVWQKIACSTECCSHSACPECYQSAMLALRDELAHYKS